MDNYDKLNKLICQVYESYEYLNNIPFFETNYIPKKSIANSVSPLKDFGLISDTKQIYWVRIPKCAQMFVTTHLEKEMRPIDFKKDYSNFTEDLYTGVAILRDPFERWLSAASTYIKWYLYNIKKNFGEEFVSKFYDDLSFLDTITNKPFLKNQFFEFLLVNLYTDYHGLPQTWFLFPCNIKKIVFFYMNDKLGYQLNHYFNFAGVSNKMNNGKINAAENDDLVYKFLLEFLSDHTNKKYKDKIMQILKPDFELLNMISFFSR